MANYKLTKGTLSRIRSDKEGVKELLNDGYILDGEVDKDYKVIDAYPKLFVEDPLEALREEAVSLGLARSTADRIKKEDTLKEKIEELKKEQD